MNADPRDEDDTELLEAEVPMHAAGRRFDQVLAEMFPDFSRSRLAEWIKSGDALLDGKQVRPREAVRGGEPVAVLVKMETETRAEPEDIPLHVLHEDEEVLVINKPAGLVVHPGAGNPRGTLVNALLHRDAKLAELPRAGIVHRLDKDTSGVMVVARTLRAHTNLVEQLSGREVHRQYVAVVAGPMIAGSTVDAPIGRHPTDRVRMAVVANGRPAITHYRVREKFRAHTVVECRLETGRTHQIRVHMAHVRHPIIGDPMYARLTQPRGATEALSEGLRAFKRQALHAEKLAFAHPATGETLTTEAGLPADMQHLLALLREDTEAFNARGGR
ncbi:23S rRNA pseudouridine(1911/1915/1917) synthase RluD [Alkalisalibacterium limincola]|uniref:Pseudouridine synthase n=1 Tax=Alkalisalibacterium limincola TaxID=2699169 RepID=A0A5C8KXC6_9GAMM|nr:23S rRNA pseudouridine(1911/1915/1917) synthase RluD [Alkalisalibacterium limincola]TXK65039.1 23S rRNA pseudouridine(1911/1915/1917) synthase RluD [Alkalisalibacterium limincola]